MMNLKRRSVVPVIASVVGAGVLVAAAAQLVRRLARKASTVESSDLELDEDLSRMNGEGGAMNPVSPLPPIA